MLTWQAKDGQKGASNAERNAMAKTASSRSVMRRAAGKHRAPVDIARELEACLLRSGQEHKGAEQTAKPASKQDASQLSLQSTSRLAYVWPKLHERASELRVARLLNKIPVLLAWQEKSGKKGAQHMRGETQ